jgi:hypothetical protein
MCAGARVRRGRVPIAGWSLGGVGPDRGLRGGRKEGGGVRSGLGEARTILLLHIISARPSKQPLMVRTFLKVYMELGSYFVSARTNKGHHHRHVVHTDRISSHNCHYVGFNLLVLQYYARTLKNSVDLGCVGRQRARRGAFYCRHLVSLCVHRETERAAH